MNDLQSVIVIKFRLKLVIGWITLLCGILILLLTLVGIADDPGLVRDPGFMTFFGIINVFMLLFAIWLLGSTTKITLHPGYMVVSRGHIPLFLWFLRTKYISNGEAQSAFVASPWYAKDEIYHVRVFREREALILVETENEDVADHLAQRIREFGEGGWLRLQ